MIKNVVTHVKQSYRLKIHSLHISITIGERERNIHSLHINITIERGEGDGSHVIASAKSPRHITLFHYVDYGYIRH